MIRAVWWKGMRNNPRHQPRHHPPRILCSVSASASGWGAKQHGGAWRVAPVCRCVRQTAARKGREGKGAFRPKAYWLSSRGGPARRHLSTLSAWGGVRCVPVKREREKESSAGRHRQYAV